MRKTYANRRYALLGTNYRSFDSLGAKRTHFCEALAIKETAHALRQRGLDHRHLMQKVFELLEGGFWHSPLNRIRNAKSLTKRVHPLTNVRIQSYGYLRCRKPLIVWSSPHSTVR